MRPPTPAVFRLPLVDMSMILSEDTDMNSVSPKLTTARLATTGLWMTVLIAAAAITAWVTHWAWLWWAVAALGVATAWLGWLIPAQVKNIKWVETEHELVVSKGKIWHSMVIVPYGRIQFVDITAGPIARALGLKRIELNTASTGEDAEIPGLEEQAADALRERLMLRARERMSGL